MLEFGFVWGVYVALEPTVRRVWPQLLISWTRLFRVASATRWSARDILVGAGAALILPGSPVRRPS